MADKQKTLIYISRLVKTAEGWIPKRYVVSPDRLMSKDVVIKVRILSNSEDVSPSFEAARSSSVCEVPRGEFVVPTVENEFLMYLAARVEDIARRNAGGYPNRTLIQLAQGLRDLAGESAKHNHKKDGVE